MRRIWRQTGTVCSGIDATGPALSWNTDVVHHDNLTCVFSDDPRLADDGVTHCHKHVEQCPINRHGKQRPPAATGKLPFKSMATLLQQPQYSLQQVLSNFGLVGVQARAIMNMIVDLEVPILILQMESLKNVAARKNLTSVVEVLNLEGYIRNEDELSAWDAGVPSLEETAFIYGFMPVSFGVDPTEASAWMKEAKIFLEGMTAVWLLDIGKFMMDDTEKELAHVRNSLAAVGPRLPKAGWEQTLYKQFADKGADPVNCKATDLVLLMAGFHQLVNGGVGFVDVAARLSRLSRVRA